MPRTRSTTSPKKKQQLDSGKSVKSSEQIPPQPSAISNKKLARKSTSVRCRKWIQSQLTEKPCLQYDQICENSGEDENSSSFNGVSDTGELTKTQNLEPRTNPTKTKVSLVCEWQRCNQIFDTFVLIREHVQSHHINDLLPSSGNGLMYQCCWDLCSFEAVEESEFRRHALHHLYHSHLKSIGEALLLRKTVPPCVLDSRRRNIIPEVPVDWMCLWSDCKDNCFLQLYDFIHHLQAHVKFEASMRRKHDPKEDQQLKCEWMGCDKVYEKTGRLMEHIRSHTQERMMACPNCGATFTSYAKFYSHFNRQAEDKKYQCVYCSKFFFNEELLTSHMYIHVNRYKCSLCDMTCPSPSGLASHVRYRHITDKPFTCQLCDFKCSHKRDLEKHKLSKHEKHVYECDEFDCGFLTESLYMMNKHDRLEHCGIMENTYGCHCCSKQFSRGHLLSQHLIKIHSFQLPSGHSRFTYCPDQEGIHRLQTMRIESLEVTRAIMSPSRSEVDTKANETTFTYKLSDIEQQGHKPESLNLVISQTPVAQKFQTPPPKETIVRPSEQSGAFSMPDLRCSDDESNNVDARNRNGKNIRKKPIKRRNQEANSNPPMQKSIQDFSVMKRYLHNEQKLNKEITIEVHTVNATGDIIKMETINTEEICVDSFEFSPSANQ